jgi:hypothetical protein
LQEDSVTSEEEFSAKNDRALLGLGYIDIE